MKCEPVQLKAMFSEIQTYNSSRYNESLRAVTDVLIHDARGFKEILSVLLLSQKQDIPHYIHAFIRRVVSNLREVNASTTHELYEFLLSTVECKEKRVRKKAFVLLQLFDVKVDGLVTLSERLFDKEKGVRKECVRLLKNYQHTNLNPRTTILSLFKDLIKYDPSPEVRRETLRAIEVTSKVHNHVICGCEDVDKSVRRVFYTEVLGMIAIKELDKEKRVFLLKRAFSERAFDAKEMFRKKCMEEYVASEVERLADDFYDEEVLLHLSELLRYYFPSHRLVLSSAFLESITLSSSYMFVEYLRFVEEELGRDDLDLMPLELYLEFLYRVCCESLVDRSRIGVAKNLFKVLGFYEVFEEQPRRIVQSMVYKMLAKNFVEEIIDEAITIPSVSTDVQFLGTLIKKNMHNENVLLLCKSVLKNVRPFSELHTAIFNEILSGHSGAADRKVVFEIMFFYCFENPDADCLRTLAENISETLPLLVDLYLSGNKSEMLRERVFRYIGGCSMDEDLAVPASKIMLLDGTDQFLEGVVGVYYGTKSDEIKQYLTVFFHEYFEKHAEVLASRFCNIFKSLAGHHKLWIDQSLHWAQKSGNVGDLIYRICVFIYKNQSFHQRLLLNMLDVMEINSNYQVLAKKVVYCCTLLLKRGVNVSSLIGKAMTVDDGEPLDRDVLDSVKRDLGITG